MVQLRVRIGFPLPTLWTLDPATAPRPMLPLTPQCTDVWRHFANRSFAGNACRTAILDNVILTVSCSTQFSYAKAMFDLR